jgi:hypothetical protein
MMGRSAAGATSDKPGIIAHAGIADTSPISCPVQVDARSTYCRPCELPVQQAKSRVGAGLLAGERSTQMNPYRSQPIIRAAAWFILAAAGATLGLVGMAAAQQPAPCPSQKTLQKNGVVYLDCPAPPDTISGKQPGWDYFAWNSFIALNWPALEVVPNRARGVPDLKKEFATAANSDLAVWETFKEKREVFNHPDTAGQLTWYSPIDYGMLRPGGVSLTGRVFHQNSGTSTRPNGLDETVEVQSQSLETNYPDGKENPVLKAEPPVVTPRVWRGQPSGKNPIVYEVKLNYDYFNYVVAKGFNVDNSSSDPNKDPVLAAAMAANIHLPIRTSSHLGAGGPNPAVLDYRAAQALGRFKLINYIYNSGLKLPIPLPPQQGSIQVKAAWLKLGGVNAKPSDYPTWHTAVAVNYISDANGNPIPSEPTLFGLVGMHIIQRIHTDPINPSGIANPPANPAGGTFIFATWEHESIFNSPVVGLRNQPKPTYSYSNFFAGEAVEHGLRKGFYPPLVQTAYPVVRQYPVLDNTKKVTAIFHDAIRKKNPNSVWLHYHLVGTQFQAVDLRNPVPQNPKFPVSKNDPTGIGQPVFLANLAIETNLGLQFFQGQPPTITVIGNYLKSPTNPNNPLSSNTALAFARNNANTAFSGKPQTPYAKPYNMGGCMGCHGVAQSKGYGFSFVLLDGYLGAVTDTQEHFDQPAANPDRAND